MATTVSTGTSCAYLASGAGEQIRIFDEEVRVKVSGAEAGGAYAVFTLSVAPGGGPPLHTHPQSETLYVLSGEFAFTVRGADGVTTYPGNPGAVLHAPGGAPHRFENVGVARGELLTVVSPELVDFLRELGAAFPPGAQPDMETMLTITAKTGGEILHGEAGSRPEPAKDGASSARARALAWEFERANDALVTLLEDCSDDRWRAIGADTGWTVGVEAHHVAVNRPLLASVARDVAEGRTPEPMTHEALDAFNARHAAEAAGIARDETIALLRESVPASAQMYRVLTDEQLALAATVIVGAPPLTVEHLTRVAIDHITEHTETIRRAIDG